MYKIRVRKEGVRKVEIQRKGYRQSTSTYYVGSTELGSHQSDILKQLSKHVFINNEKVQKIFYQIEFICFYS